MCILTKLAKVCCLPVGRGDVSVFWDQRPRFWEQAVAAEDEGRCGENELMYVCVDE